MDDSYAVRLEHLVPILRGYLAESAIETILKMLEPVAVSMRDEDSEIFGEITEVTEEIASVLTRIAKKFSQILPEPDLDEEQGELVLRLSSLFELLKVPKADRDALSELAGKVVAHKKLLQTLSANMTALRILKRELASVKQLKADYEEEVGDKAQDLLNDSMEGIEEDLLLAMLQKLYNIGLLNISQHPTSLSDLKPSDTLALMEVFELITI